MSSISLADRAVAFLGKLRHTKAPFAGQPFALRPWQEEIVRGIMAPEVTTAFVALPRKNGKSQLIAGLMLFFLLSLAEPEDEIYSAASSKDQAALIFRAAASMVRADPLLNSLLVIRQSKMLMRYPKSGGKYQAISSDGPGAHGLNPGKVLCDELHAWRQGGYELWDALTSGSDTRPDPKTIVITTAGTNVNSKCYELWQDARKVRDGITVDPSFYACIYEAPPDGDPFDEDLWRACNPALGDFKRIESMRAKAKLARRIPSELDGFRQLQLNQWVQSASKWIHRDEWLKGNGSVPDLRGRQCWAGLDLSATTDTTALSLVFPPSGDEPWYVLPYFFLPSENIHRRGKQDLASYSQWAQQGFLQLTPGNAVDQSFVLTQLRELARDYRIQGVAVDRHLAGMVSAALQDDGFLVIEWGQGYVSMSPASKAFERLILAGRLVHGGHPVLAWQIDNAVIDRDPADNIKPTKSRSTDRIDGVVATIMALGAATSTDAAPSPPSVYESRGVLTLSAR